MKIFKKLDLPQTTIMVFLLLLSADIFIILLHVLHLASKVIHNPSLTSIVGDYSFNIMGELGLGESFQYVKELWITLLLMWVVLRKRLFSYAGWALLYGYLLFDDMLGIHEGLASAALNWLGFAPDQLIFQNVRYQDFGELGVVLFLGLAFLSLIVLGYLRGTKEIRRTFRYLSGSFLFLIFFGVVADFIARLFTNEIQMHIVGTFEDGGEMIAMSIICSIVFALAQRIYLRPDSNEPGTSF